MIYPQLLKSDFEKLPDGLRQFHAAPKRAAAAGSVSVRHSHPVLARLVGFPPAGEKIPLRLEVVCEPDCEIWLRRFGDDERRSVQRCRGGLLVEQLGPLRVEFRVYFDDAGLHLESQRALLWGLPLPVRIRAVERGTGSGWTFEVHVALVGSYAGAVEVLR